MRYLHRLAVAFAIVPALAFASPVLAVVNSSIEGGNIYKVKNVTKGTDFTDPVNADACDTLQYKVWLHNPGPTETLHNVTVQASFQSSATTDNISSIIVRTSNGEPNSTSDTARVNLSSAQSVNYVSGSAQLLGANGQFLQTLPDAIVGSGVNIGSIGVSIGEKRFVQFQAKVNCPAAPVSKEAPRPAALPTTGPASALGIFAGVGGSAAIAHYLVTRRRL
ncbi:MAG: hypothetical protein WD877_01810 [Candidatus Saccharimonadales bacterium]